MNLAIHKENFNKNRDNMLNDYRALLHKDMQEKAANLKIGEKLTRGEFDGFHNPANKETAKDILNKYRNNAENILKDIYNEISGYVSDVPTEETARALQSMQLIKEPTQEYIDSMVEKHGNNYTALNVLNEYAIEHNMSITTPDSIAEYEKAHQYYNNLKAETDHYTTLEIDRISPGYVAFVDEILR